jgi:hypothetical protein
MGARPPSCRRGDGDDEVAVASRHGRGRQTQGMCGGGAQTAGDFSAHDEPARAHGRPTARRSEACSTRMGCAALPSGRQAFLS